MAMIPLRTPHLSSYLVVRVLKHQCMSGSTFVEKWLDLVQLTTKLDPHKAHHLKPCPNNQPGILKSV
jgi:hypothetical protein